MMDAAMSVMNSAVRKLPDDMSGDSVAADDAGAQPFSSVLGSVVHEHQTREPAAREARAGDRSGSGSGAGTADAAANNASTMPATQQVATEDSDVADASDATLDQQQIDPAVPAELLVMMGLMPPPVATTDATDSAAQCATAGDAATTLAASGKTLPLQSDAVPITVAADTTEVSALLSELTEVLTAGDDTATTAMRSLTQAVAQLQSQVSGQASSQMSSMMQSRASADASVANAGILTKTQANTQTLADIKSLNASLGALLEQGGQLSGKTGASAVEADQTANNDAASNIPQWLSRMPGASVEAGTLMTEVIAQWRNTVNANQDGAQSNVATSLSDTAAASVAALAATAQPTGTQLASDITAAQDIGKYQLHSAVGSAHWASELGNKLTMMATDKTQSATLHMSPADMGPVQVRIETQHSQASVWFTADNADTRTALEQSLPKLREMFTAQGMSLTDAGVFGDRSQQQSHNRPSYFASATVMDDETLADTATVRSLSLSLVDAYV